MLCWSKRCQRLMSVTSRSATKACSTPLRIAKDIGVSRYTVYRFLNDEKLSKRTAAGLKRISKGNLTDSDLLPYLMRL